MKDMNDPYIDLDSIFEGVPFNRLDAVTQVYVLNEFGSEDAYETSRLSFQRIRSAMDSDKDFSPDEEVKKNLLALFDKEDDRKVVPLIPPQNKVGLSFLRSPYFQLGVAASLVLVALYFIPWGNYNGHHNLASVTKNDQRMADGKKTETSHGVNRSLSSSDNVSESNHLVFPEEKEKLKERDNTTENTADESVVPGREISDRMAYGETNEENSAVKKSEETKSEGEKNTLEEPVNTIALSPQIDQDYSDVLKTNTGLTEKDKTERREKEGSKKDAKSISKENRNQEQERSNTRDDNRITDEAPASASGTTLSPNRVKGISMDDKKDLMQFFFTTL